MRLEIRWSTSASTGYGDGVITVQTVKMKAGFFLNVCAYSYVMQFLKIYFTNETRGLQISLITWIFYVHVDMAKY